MKAMAQTGATGKTAGTKVTTEAFLTESIRGGKKQLRYHATMAHTRDQFCFQNSLSPTPQDDSLGDGPRNRTNSLRSIRVKQSMIIAHSVHSDHGHPLATPLCTICLSSPYLNYILLHYHGICASFYSPWTARTSHDESNWPSTKMGRCQSQELSK